MRQQFTFEVRTPKGWDQEQVVEALIPPGERLYLNRDVLAVEIHLDDDETLFLITMSGRDQWWIRKRVFQLLPAVFRFSGLNRKLFTLVGQVTLETKKNYRYWSSGERNKGSRIPEPHDGKEPPKKKIVVKMWPTGMEKRSGWHQTYQGTGR